MSAALLDPKSGNTIGYKETKGTTAEPFIVPMAWQSSSLSYVSLNVDSNGSLLVNGIGGTLTVTTLDETSRIDTVTTANAVYTGSAAPGSAEGSAVWKITKTNLVGGSVISVLYANGSPSYTNVWANRAGLSYG
jgi:hypothetical protein